LLTNAAGCDSFVTLNLTINNSTNGTDVQTACDTYTWIDGLTYNASTNTPTFLLTNAAGCDSHGYLKLNHQQLNNGTDVQTACDTYTWIDGLTYNASTNTPTFTYVGGSVNRM
jgi:flagellar capping protein FliD